MRCPKCGYVSFDHNESCPKCNRDLSSERERLNLITFSPDPPYLLADLLGDVNESGIHFHSAESGAFNVLEEELEFEAETEEMEVSAAAGPEDTEIEIELDSITDEEDILPKQELSFGTTEAQTLTTSDTEESKPVGIDPGASLTDLDLEISEVESTKQEETLVRKEPPEPEPVAFEMEDITLEDSSAEEEFDLQLVQDDLSEASTEDSDTGAQDEYLTLEKEVSAIEDIAVVPESAVSEETIAITDVLDEKREPKVPEPEIEPALSLDELKDDDLGEVDVTIDEEAEPTQKIVDGHGK
ncbi:MAG: hypothetical protein JRI39_05550 [Deltaproteobacteria bacterium]|nr:hypothetical protein [Deltaproteobacteria bacterium]MBW2082555.1 hypothetical protein [Deltaproteobacteria bacterium]